MNKNNSLRGVNNLLHGSGSHAAYPFTHPFIPSPSKSHL